MLIFLSITAVALSDGLIKPDLARFTVIAPAVATAGVAVRYMFWGAPEWFWQWLMKRYP